MNIQCRTCWTVFPAELAERVNTQISNRVLVCPACADTFDQVIPREEWTPAEVEEVEEENVAEPTIADVAEAVRFNIEEALELDGIPVGEEEQDGEERFWVTEVTMGATTEGHTSAFRIKLNSGKTFHVTIEEGDDQE